MSGMVSFFIGFLRMLRNVERVWNWLTMRLRRPSAFNLHYVLVTFAWLALGRKPGTMLATFVVGFKHSLTERKVCSSMLIDIEILTCSIIAYIRSTVTDGVTIGRPTCCVHDCDNPLESVKDRFCLTHADQDLLCVVTTCSEHAEEGRRTCSSKEHHELENYNSEKNKAMFQLKERLAHLRTSQPRESIPEAGDDIGQDEEVLVDNDGVCDEKPEEGNQTLRARFGRKRTHNEELCVSSCGIILGRATFYGSEAPNGVVVSQGLPVNSSYCFWSLICFSHFGRSYFRLEDHCLLFSGTTTTVVLWQCSIILAVPIHISNTRHFQSTFFISSANTRSQTNIVTSTAILPTGPSSTLLKEPGGSIPQLLNKQTHGLGVIKLLCARCKQTGMNSFLMK